MAIYIGTPSDVYSPSTLKAGLAEFISTLIFIFAGQGSGMAIAELANGGARTPAGLVATSIAHAFAYSVAVSVGANISGGHVNPAVTFGALIGGNITLLTGILYWIAQLLGSIAACFLLKLSTGGSEVSAFASPNISVWNALVLEIVMTFILVHTVYSNVIDPKKGDTGINAPLTIGLIVGANTLVGGAFSGASMNPAA